MNNLFHLILKRSIYIKNIIHSNIYMIIGSYGILSIFLIFIMIEWFFPIDIGPISDYSLPPAWQKNGDIDHLLGTDNLGHDIFAYLLIAYKKTCVLTLIATMYVIVIGAIINCLLLFIPFLRIIVIMVLRLIVAIPPLLSIFVVFSIWQDHINAILITVCLSYLPKFICNVDLQLMNEWNKPYVTAHRLDGLSSYKIVNSYIIPNIFSNYLSEVISLFSQLMLVITTLTFLGFGDNLNTIDIGVMMSKMLSILDINHWAFLSSGMIIIFTIMIVNLFNLGIHLILTKRVEN